jgi:hypothetical protein
LSFKNADVIIAILVLILRGLGTHTLNTKDVTVSRMARRSRTSARDLPGQRLARSTSVSMSTSAPP